MMARLRTALQRNLPAKLIALIIAIVLWLFVMNEQNPQIDGSFTVNVELVNVPEGYKITQTEKNVKLKVRGARSFFVAAEPEGFKAYADIAGLESGDHKVKVHAVLPQGFELVDVQPENISVYLDEIIQKSVRIDLIVTGAAAAGYTVGKISQEADTTIVKGPKSRVEEIDRAIGYVGLSGNRESFTLQVPLTPINSDGKAVEEVELLSRSLNVSVQLARGLTRKIVSVHPVVDETLPEGFTLEKVQVDPLKIEIAGDVSVITKLSSIDTEKIIVADMKQSGKKTVHLAVPEGVAISNREVVVMIELKPQASKKDKTTEKAKAKEKEKEIGTP